MVCAGVGEARFDVARGLDGHRGQRGELLSEPDEAPAHGGGVGAWAHDEGDAVVIEDEVGGGEAGLPKAVEDSVRIEPGAEPVGPHDGGRVRRG